MENLVDVLQCLLEKFNLDGDGFWSNHNKYPVEICYNCNFANFLEIKFENVCYCPKDLSKSRYVQLLGEFNKESFGSLNRQDFWEFVKENYKG